MYARTMRAALKNDEHKKKLNKQCCKIGVTIQSYSESMTFFKRKNLALLQADKEGSFVAMPRTLWNDKALVALNKYFVLVKKRFVSLKEQ